MPDEKDYTALQHQLIREMIKGGSSVLDLGCADGRLMQLLVREKQAKVQGIEINESAIYDCVAKGLSVMHGDIDSGLAEYGDRSFDYVILNHSLQQVRRPDTVLREALRVGKKVVVGFPNFAHFSIRWSLGCRGRTPVTPSLPYQWYDSPNLHFLSVADFQAFCRRENIRIERFQAINKTGIVRFWPNLFGESGLFLISK